MDTSPPVHNPNVHRPVLSEAMFMNTFRLVKEHLVCPQHPGENRWCWVDSSIRGAEHIPLCLGDIQSWTKHLHFYGGDVSCTVMPDTAYFDKLRKSGPRSASLCRTPTEPVVVPPTNVPRHRDLHRQYAMYIEYNGESGVEEREYLIKEILDALHARYPAFDYPKYEEPLQTLGIHYLITVSMFDEMFYITRVGMVVGAAHMFCAWVEKEMHRVKLGERGQVGSAHVVDNEDRENIDR